MSNPHSVPCGISIPQVFPDSPVDIDLIRSYIKRADNMSYHSLWVQEQILGSTPSIEPLTLLCYSAALTDRVRLGTSMIIATTRNPTLLAKELSSLDHLSNGRLIIGLALGGRRRQYPLLGGPSEKRILHLIESLQVMKSLWDPHNTNHNGHFWTLSGEHMEPSPLQTPHPPILLGGRHPNSLARAVKHADGWMGAGSTSSQEFGKHVDIIKSNLDQSGKDPSQFFISKRVYIALDDNDTRAENRLRNWFGHRYGDSDMASNVSVWGNLSRCIEGIQEIVEKGAHMLLLNPVFDHIEHLEALHNDVIPNLKSDQATPKSNQTNLDI